MKIKFIISLFLLTILFACSNQSNNQAIRLGNFKNRPRGFHAVNMPGGQIALFIENNLNKTPKIQNIKYFVGDKGDYTKPFIVKLYSVDTITGKPSENLLPNMISISAANKNSWVNVDISAYNILFPKEGIYVAMEWRPSNNFNTANQSEHQYLAYSKIKNKNLTWYCALGMHWYQLPDCDYNTMISIDVK